MGKKIIDRSSESVGTQKIVIFYYYLGLVEDGINQKKNKEEQIIYSCKDSKKVLLL